MRQHRNTAYVGHGYLGNLIGQLKGFRDHIHGGITDIRVGEFGSEYANAFHARLHFRAPGRLFITTHQQSEFSPFSVDEVASEAKMYVTNEPVLLDNFISELGELANNAKDDASWNALKVDQPEPTVTANVRSWPKAVSRRRSAFAMPASTGANGQVRLNSRRSPAKRRDA